MCVCAHFNSSLLSLTFSSDHIARVFLLKGSLLLRNTDRTVVCDDRRALGHVLVCRHFFVTVIAREKKMRGQEDGRKISLVENISN